ncbi:MAG: TolC family protein [Deltaproteobacteria bacterium]|nr:TolC family protein [Deltaproteobacteria bacterium]
MKPRRFFLFLAIGAVAFLTCILSDARATETEKKFTLDECVEMALKFSPEIKETNQDVEIARTRLDEAKAYFWPQLEALGLAAPVSDAKGNQVESSYSSDRIQGIGPFGSIDVSLVQPLYTFGKLSSAKEAATHGIKVDESRVQQKATDVALQVKQFYHGIAFANDGEKLVNEIDTYLESALKRTRKLLEAESEHATQLDLDKLEAFKGVVEKYRNKAVKSKILAKEALRAYMGLPRGTEMAIVDETLVPIDVDVQELEHYIQESQTLRPEITQLKEGLAAKEALVDVAAADYFPTLFVGAFYSYAYAPDRDRVTNPWIYDYANHQAGGVGVGLKWSLNFGITTAKVDRSKAEVLKLKKTQDFAETGIPLQVEQSYRDLIEARKNIDALETAQKAARKWMVGASSNYDLGIGTSKDLADAVVAYGTIKMDYLTSVYNFNMGYANLAQASGTSVLEVSNKY